MIPGLGRSEVVIKFTHDTMIVLINPHRKSQKTTNLQLRGSSFSTASSVFEIRRFWSVFTCDKAHLPFICARNATLIIGYHGCIMENNWKIGQYLGSVENDIAWYWYVVAPRPPPWSEKWEKILSKSHPSHMKQAHGDPSMCKSPTCPIEGCEKC